VRRFGRLCSGTGLALLLLSRAPVAVAQVSSTGNVYGTVNDESGAVLPGVTATLSGDFGSRTTTTGAGGEFRFLNVDHGTHKLAVSLTGFSTVHRDVTVTAGTNVNVPFTLKVATVEETITVQSETPVVDTKKTGTGTTISKAELEAVPSSRDPWALLRTIPGVLVDRVNVAGSESGQQSNFIGKGADPKDATWSLDGVVVTDMSAIGASPTYFTYDSFDEVSFSTGGNDVRVATGGIGIGLVTKRGTNTFHGGANGYFTHDDFQSSNLPDELRNDPRLRGSDKADHTDQIADYSVDLGGPVVKDRLWFYGSYEKNDIRIRNLRQVPDRTVLKNYLGKLNWQATGNDMVSLFWFNGAKIKLGRAGSAANFGLPNTEGTFWDQGNFYPGQPHGFTKAEWNHTFGPSFFLSAKGSYYSTGFTLKAQGDDSVPFIIDNLAGVARGTANTRSFSRPMYTGNLDGNYFFAGLGGGHELKFGGSWRRTDATSTDVYPAGGLQLILNVSSNRARFYRQVATGKRTDYATAYLADTFTRGRLSLNLGLRFDRQTGGNLPSSVPAQSLIPNDLPGLDYPGGGTGVSWNDLSPRAGFSYALDEGRKTVVRASYARYAGQLSIVDTGWDNPLGTTYLEHEWVDANRDGQFQMSERGRQTRVFNFDPDNPNAVSSVNQIDPNFHSNRDHEIVAGIERELAPNLAVSAAYTWRKSTDLTASQLLSGYYWYSWIGVQPSSFHRGTPVAAKGFTAVPWILDPAVAADATGGLLLTNRPNYNRTFNGLELSLVKRLSSKWMARAAFSYNDWKEHFGPGAIMDPTKTALDPQMDGGQVVNFGAASGKFYYVNAKWQANLNALYQLPANFELAGNLFGRQGYPKPYTLNIDTEGLIGFQSVLAEGPIDQFRYPNVWDVDLRLAKNLGLGGSRRITIAAEVFNALNANTELYRNTDATSSALNRLDEILAPRIFRISGMLSF
jgi:hypothetical protein